MSEHVFLSQKADFPLHTPTQSEQSSTEPGHAEPGTARFSLVKGDSYVCDNNTQRSSEGESDSLIGMVPSNSASQQLSLHPPTQLPSTECALLDVTSSHWVGSGGEVHCSFGMLNEMEEAEDVDMTSSMHAPRPHSSMSHSINVGPNNGTAAAGSSSDGSTFHFPWDDGRGTSSRHSAGNPPRADTTSHPPLKESLTPRVRYMSSASGSASGRSRMMLPTHSALPACAEDPTTNLNSDSLSVSQVSHRGGSVQCPWLSSSNNNSGSCCFNLFQPQPLVALQADSPPPPDLCVEDLPPGTCVWIGSSEDVRRVLGTFWLHGMELVTNWKVLGTVVRHSGSYTLVSFFECRMGFTFPRALLYLNPPKTFHAATSDLALSLSS